MALYGNKNMYDDFDMGYSNYYGGYDNNQYISDGHNYFSNEYDYVDNEYNNRGMQRDQQYYFENLSDYGQQYYNGYDQSLYDISNGINNNLNQEMEFDQFMGNNIYANSNQYANNYNYNNSRQEFYERHQYNQQNTVYQTPENLVFDDAYVVQNQYIDEDDEKLLSVKDLLSLLICVAFAVVLALLITSYVVQHTQVDGTSMLYNFNNKDILIIDKLSYRFSKPKRFDVIIFPTQRNVYYIKRIIGLPGEKISIKSDGSIYINGNVLDEDYGYETITNFGTNTDMELGENEYYVLGDNRNHSEDSRYPKIGAINGNDITGKANIRIWPLDNIRRIDNSVNARIKQSGNMPNISTEI